MLSPPIHYTHYLDDLITHLANQLASIKTWYCITDDYIYQQYRHSFFHRLNQVSAKVNLIKIKKGEKNKSLPTWEYLISSLLSYPIRRNEPVIAIGGGVIGDLGGFVAASILRGVPLVHIPTTLMAMVDSSIGGKVGINHSLGKNMIGSFYQPYIICIGFFFLSTLKKKEWSNGLSEIIKYGCIYDESILTQLEEWKNIPSYHHPIWEHLIKRCIRIKQGFCAQDYLEKNNRLLLNFGHTFGHALEKVSKYQINHGHAVFIGMLVALVLSQKQGYPVSYKRLAYFIPWFNSNIDIQNISIIKLLEAMHHDKKHGDKGYCMIILVKWGKARQYYTQSSEEIQSCWKWVLDKLINIR